ncbi:transcriptional regulator [Halovenus sp. WSH3]|uniref:HTH-type transcriptional regulator n=1 Tax=Halovenus carboxidivorans TaxID=2692199 RepID=A0A6B0T2J6_9EURY|nr:transcriptional regulator [Halovenus carboxidivorans]MXR50456.1 transcriptional regulator [Halovenus carboxidivorans]
MDDSDQEPDIDERRERAREEVLDAMERAAEIYGLSRSYGRLYGLLFFAEEPMSLDDLVERSEYAKSTVSTAMNSLQRLHLVHRRSIPGEGKKAFYEAERDFWTVFQEFLRREVRREVDTMIRSLDRAEQHLDGLDDEQAQRDLEKIRQLRRMYDRSQSLIDILTSSSLDRLAGLLERLRRD